MPEIISFGQYESRRSIFKLVWLEFLDLSLFTKLTIIFAILLPLVVFKSTGEILQQNNYASQPIAADISSALPPNCHLAIDFTQCTNKSSCEPKPKITCDVQK